MVDFIAKLYFRLFLHRHVCCCRYAKVPARAAIAEKKNVIFLLILNHGLVQETNRNETSDDRVQFGRILVSARSAFTCLSSVVCRGRGSVHGVTKVLSKIVRCCFLSKRLCSASKAPKRPRCFPVTLVFFNCSCDLLFFVTTFCCFLCIILHFCRSVDGRSLRPRFGSRPWPGGSG